MRITTALRILVATATLFAACPAAAESNSLRYTQHYKALKEMNKSNILFNTQYESLNKVLKGNIIDNKNRIIGTIRDVYINPYGAIASVDAEFDRLRLRQSVPLSYRQMGIRPAGNGYALGFDAKEIEEIYPSLLANVEPAAGTGREVFSVRSLKGAQVKTTEGQPVGRVSDILFTAQGGRVEALYITLEVGTQRGKGAAVPMGAIRLPQNGSGLVMETDQARALEDFIRGN